MTQEKLRLRYLASRLHALGEKPLWHFLSDIENGKPIRRPTLEEYSGLDADFIHDYGGDKFGPVAFSLKEMRR
jgi:hypothetical protein